jgi:prolyl-tRNA synthetase
MDRAGAFELLMPAVQPASCGRNRSAGTSTARNCCASRIAHDRDFVIGPTHEEVITDLARRELKSYRQLPVNFYQIQVKFRDEIRPRFGVMRGREFIMKDAYSFHADAANRSQQGYEHDATTYTRMFTRMGLQFRAVRADTGSIGGSASEEFQVLADSGEDAIAVSDGDRITPRIWNWPRRYRRANARQRPKPCARSRRRHRRPAMKSRHCSDFR